MREALAVLALLVVLSPGVSAGRQEDPELACPEPGAQAKPGLPLLGPLADAVDIIAVWIDDETNETVNFTMQVEDFSTLEAAARHPETYARFEVQFDTSSMNRSRQDVPSWHLRATMTGGPPGPDWDYALMFYEENGSIPIPVAGTSDGAAGLIRFQLGRQLLESLRAGTVLTIDRAMAFHTAPPVLDPYSTCLGPGRPFAFSTGNRTQIFEGPDVPGEASPEPIPGSNWVVLAAVGIACLGHRRAGR